MSLFCILFSFQATGQRALEKKYETIRRKVYFWAVIISVIIVSVAAFLPLIFSKFADDWQGVEAFRTILFVNVWYTNAFVAIAVTFNAVANGMCLLINIIACECLKQEFHHLNCQLRRINIRDNESFKKVALEHSRLLKCLDYLHEYLSVYVFICLAVITIMTIIFAYMLMLDIAPPLRFLAGLWIISNSVIAFVFCNSAETLHITVSAIVVAYSLIERLKLNFNTSCKILLSLRSFQSIRAICIIMQLLTLELRVSLIFYRITRLQQLKMPYSVKDIVE